ncbi:MAG: tetratricopeptide repeat protein [Desulfobacteraceae bacterium]|nr:tetratricopeptide repeat protein [Desulfobacteraceae bacterium]
MTTPFVSLCMIVKDEEQNLPECLGSVAALVDEIVVVDTGSEDSTVAIAESFGAKVFHLPWPGDFAAARNFSLGHAAGKWILYLDADERLDTNGRDDCLRKAASDPLVDAWSVSIRNFKYGSDACDTTSNIRLFRNLPEIRFENEVHERVEPSLIRMGAKIALAPFYIDHLGYRLPPNLMREKLKRNLELSQKHLDRDPDDAYGLYYLGTTLLQLDRHEESRARFERVLRSENLPRPLRAMTNNILAYLCLEGNNPGEALLFAEKSAALAPRQNTCHLITGLALFQKGDFGGALPLLLRALEFMHLPPDNSQSSLSQEYAFVDEPELHKLIGVCCSEVGRLEDAASHLRKSIESGVRDPEIFRRAGVCCVNTGEFASGLSYLEEAGKLGSERGELLLPMAFASVRLREFSRAEAFLAEAEKHPSQDSAKISQIRDCLEAELGGLEPEGPRETGFANDDPGDPSGPGDCLRIAAEKGPEIAAGTIEGMEGGDDASALYHLGMTCLMLGREAEALGSFDRALSGSGLTPRLEAGILNTKSYLHLKAGDYDSALSEASRSLGILETQNSARLLTGLCLFHKRDFGAAVPWLLEGYRSLSRPSPDRFGDSCLDRIDKGDLVEMIGICFAETGNFTEAIPFLKLTVKRNPESAVLERLGVCLLNAGEFSEALEYLKGARARSGDSHALALPISFAFFRTGDFCRARENYRNAVPKDENELFVAFQLLEAMASEKSFKPYLRECVMSKLDLFRRTLPAKLDELLSELALSGLIFENIPQHAEA